MGYLAVTFIAAINVMCMMMGFTALTFSPVIASCIVAVFTLLVAFTTDNWKEALRIFLLAVIGFTFMVAIYNLVFVFNLPWWWDKEIYIQ